MRAGWEVKSAFGGSQGSEVRMLVITLRVWGLCTQGEGGGLARFKWAILFSPNELKEDKRAARREAYRNKRPIRLGQAWSLYMPRK